MFHSDVFRLLRRDERPSAHYSSSRTVRYEIYISDRPPTLLLHTTTPTTAVSHLSKPATHTNRTSNGRNERGGLDYDLSDLDELDAGWSVMSKDSEQRKAGKDEKQMSIDEMLGLVHLRPSPSSKRKRGAYDQASNKAQKVVEQKT
jgi:hypothetical protein